MKQPKHPDGPRPLKLSEREVVAGCRKLLTLLRNQGRLTFRRVHVGGKIIRGRIFKNSDMVGMADTLVFLPQGVTLHVEYKAHNGRQRPEQRQWQNELEGLGHSYVLVRSVDDLISILRIMGIEHWSFSGGEKCI